MNNIKCKCNTECSGLTIEHNCNIVDHIYCDKEHKIIYVSDKSVKKDEM